MAATVRSLLYTELLGMTDDLVWFISGQTGTALRILLMPETLTLQA